MNEQTAGVTNHSELSQEDRQYVDHVERWLAEKGVALTCAACKQSGFIVMRLMAAPVTDLNQLIHEDEGRLTTHMLVPLMCGNCAHVVLFNALAMGLPLDTVLLTDGKAEPS